MSCRRTSNAFASFAVADSSRARIASYYYWRRAESDPRGLAIGIGMTEAMLARAAQAGPAAGLTNIEVRRGDAARRLGQPGALARFWDIA